MALLPAGLPVPSCPVRSNCSGLSLERQVYGGTLLPEWWLPEWWLPEWLRIAPSQAVSLHEPGNPYRSPGKVLAVSGSSNLGPFRQTGGKLPDDARSRLTAALISARWVYACGKLPSASPAGPICSANRPTWLACVSIFSKMYRPSASRPARVSASTYQNEHMLNVPSLPCSPSTPPSS